MVIRYAYLWRNEYNQGLEEGAKSRPCAVLLATTDSAGDTKAIVLPVTHTPPRDTALAIEVPAATKRRLGLDDERSWIVIAEANRFTWPGPDVRPMKSGDATTIVYGELPANLFRAIREKWLALSTAKRSLINRTE